MKFVIAAGVLAAFVGVVTVAAGPATGTTEPLDGPISGTTMDVQLTVHTTAPVVPYEYAIQNECRVPGQPGRTIQRDDIVNWTFVEGGDPAAIMPIDLGGIPVGSECKVFIAKNNVVVKGSTTNYVVD